MSVATLNLASTAERAAREQFVRTHAAKPFRDLLTHIYAKWYEYNADFFENKLVVPHIGIGVTPKRFSTCSPTTTYGGVMDITLSEPVALGRAPIVKNPWPAPGAERFLYDLLLAETVRQYVLEVLHVEEKGYGARFAEVATPISRALGLADVPVRRRGDKHRGQPVAAFWPMWFRPDGYYAPDICLSMERAAGFTTRTAQQSFVPGLAAYLLFLTQTGRTDRLQEVLGRMVDAETVARSPAVAWYETSPHDETGMPLPMPSVDPAWLGWNGGCVRAIATGIRSRHEFDGMPVLADALQDAGCENDVLLGHLRAPCSHTAKCWALKLLAEPPSA